MGLAELIGQESARKLSDTYGGQRKYVAKNPDRLTWLAEVLEQSEVHRIWQEFYGCYLEIPKRRRLGGSRKAKQRNAGVRRDRNIAIYQLSFEMPRSDLARLFGLQLREIQRIIKAMTPTPPEGPKDGPPGGDIDDITSRFSYRIQG